MAEADSCIADLDEVLAGEDIVVFQRFTTDTEGVRSVTNTATCWAKVNSAAPQELQPMGGEAPNTHIIISPTGLIAAGWPGLPGKDDRVLIGGVANNIEIVTPKSVGGQVVRIELQTRT
jgi:hypothetical protein